MEIGIVGFGRFGQFAAEILRRDFDVYVFDRRPSPKKRGIRRVTLERVASKPCLILCVPISQMEAVCRELRPYLVEGHLIMDTCSVKEKPLRIMREFLPKSVEVLGTHPLFGPDSARDGVEGLEVVLCPGRCNRVDKVKAYLEARGLVVTVTTASNHDRAMAKTQALFHFLSQGFSCLDIDTNSLATPGPAQLFQGFRDVLGDSKELFRDLQQLNRFVPSQRKKLIASLIALDKQLSKRSPCP